MDEKTQKDLIEASKEVLATSGQIWKLMQEKDELILLLKKENAKLFDENVLLQFRNNELATELINIKGIYLDI